MAPEVIGASKLLSSVVPNSVVGFVSVPKKTVYPTISSSISLAAHCKLTEVAEEIVAPLAGLIAYAGKGA